MLSAYTAPYLRNGMRFQPGAVLLLGTFHNVWDIRAVTTGGGGSVLLASSG